MSHLFKNKNIFNTESLFNTQLFAVQIRNKMNFISTEYFSLILSLNHLSIYLNDILKQGGFRTTMIYYENRTTFDASAIIKMISQSNTRYSAAYVAINIDHLKTDFKFQQFEENLGSDFFNIFVYDNIVDEKPVNLNETIYFQSQSNTIFLCNQAATGTQIANFFQNIWNKSVLNAALILWHRQIKIYTHFPYQNNFLVKLFETSTDEYRPLPTNFYRKLFGDKASNLNNVSFNTFSGSDPPKMFRIPGRFRIGKTYHIGGRDGFIANLAEKVLNACWIYRSIFKLFAVIDFKYNHSGFVDDPYDVWGEQILSYSNEVRTTKLKIYNISTHFEQS